MSGFPEVTDSPKVWNSEPLYRYFMSNHNLSGFPDSLEFRIVWKSQSLCTHKIIFTQLGRVNWKWLKVVLVFTQNCVCGEKNVNTTLLLEWGEYRSSICAVKITHRGVKTTPLRCDCDLLYLTQFWVKFFFVCRAIPGSLGLGEVGGGESQLWSLRGFGMICDPTPFSYFLRHSAPIFQHVSLSTKITKRIIPEKSPPPHGRTSEFYTFFFISYFFFSFVS